MLVDIRLDDTSLIVVVIFYHDAAFTDIESARKEYALLLLGRRQFTDRSGC